MMLGGHPDFVVRKSKIVVSMDIKVAIEHNYRVKVNYVAINNYYICTLACIFFYFF